MNIMGVELTAVTVALSILLGLLGIFAAMGLFARNYLKVPPSNKLEKLKGDLTGFWSIRVNDQYRVLFRFANGNAEQVRITDYH